jgi:hypothetical protein
MYYARFVTIPDDALVWTEGDKFKADQMSLSDRVLIGDLEVWWNNDYNLRACQRNPRAFRYVKEKTEEFWLSIIISDGGYSLQFVDESFQTEKICLAAVQQFGRALRYVKDSRQTETICLAAVRQNGLALQYVKESLRTRKVCLAAVEANFHALQYVDVGDQTKEICLAAFIDGCPPYSHYFKDPEGFNKQSAWEEYVAREKNLFIIC